jgi:hypothetical protein
MSRKALKHRAPSNAERQVKDVNPSEAKLRSTEMKDKTVLKVFKGVTNFYGNNTVYITDGNRGVQKLEDYNYQIEAVQDTGDDIWITSGVIVALGACCELPDAVRQLKIILVRLKADAMSVDATEQRHKPEKYACKPIRRKS